MVTKITTRCIARLLAEILKAIRLPSCEPIIVPAVANSAAGQTIEPPGKRVATAISPVPTMTAVLCALHDVTQRKEAELLIKRSTSELAEMAKFPDMNPGLVCRLDRSGSVVLANAAARSAFGDETLVGQSWFEICPRFSTEMWDDCFSDSESVRHEAEINGDCLEFIYQCDAEGQFVFAFGSNITQHKRLEKVLAAQAAELQEMATFPDMNPGPVLRTDLDGAIILANRAARKLFDDDELVSRNWRDLCPGMNPTIWQRMLAQETPFEHEASSGKSVLLYTHSWLE